MQLGVVVQASAQALTQLFPGQRLQRSFAEQLAMFRSEGWQLARYQAYRLHGRGQFYLSLRRT